MIEKLNDPPVYWLYPDHCEKLYRGFSQKQFFGPLPDYLTRYKGRVESILGSVRQSFEAEYIKPSILKATVAYFYYFAVGHPFQDGNKRMATLFSHFFLMVNGFEFTSSPYDLYKIAVEAVELSHKHGPNEIKEKLENIFSESIGIFGESRWWN